MLRQVVMVGAGQAGVQAIDTLRRRGHDGAITLIGEEPLEPYQRPPLSKGYLTGAVEPERLMLRPARFYRDRGVDLRLGVRAGELLAIETVNRGQDQIAARKLIAARARLDHQRLADAAIPLAECALW
jgi:3-phenylpropionate/trans-cinnamate dioxygenase ferredoxin reductase component